MQGRLLLQFRLPDVGLETWEAHAQVRATSLKGRDNTVESSHLKTKTLFSHYDYQPNFEITQIPRKKK